MVLWCCGCLVLWFCGCSFSAVQIVPGAHRWVPRCVLFCRLRARKDANEPEVQLAPRSAKQDVTRSAPQPAGPRSQATEALGPWFCGCSFSAVQIVPGAHRWVPRYVLFCRLRARKDANEPEVQLAPRSAKQDVTRSAPQPAGPRSQATEALSPCCYRNGPLLTARQFPPLPPIR